MRKRYFPLNAFKASLSLAVFIVLLLSSNPLFACKIDLKAVGEEKKLYKAGDIIGLNLVVAFTHRVCPTAISETKFNVEGLEISEATDWKETRPGMVYEKTLKLKVISNKEGKLTLSVVRECPREGGFGSISFKAEPLK
jgi:hypothetical protein